MCVYMSAYVCVYEVGDLVTPLKNGKTEAHRV